MPAATLAFGEIETAEPQSASPSFDMLSLEMQRSMDYYESQYGNGAADRSDQ